jgi:hypothetical protein
MRLDRQDIFPLSVILLFSIVIPFGLWLGFGTRQQILHELYGAATAYTVAILAFVLLIGCLRSIRGKRILTERGEQSSVDFVAQFTSESERRAATLVLETLRELSAVTRMPRLERGDQMTGPPLFLAQGDLEERLETLCGELDFSLWLDSDGASVLFNAKTVEQLVLALAHFIEQRAANSVVIGSSDC